MQQNSPPKTGASQAFSSIHMFALYSYYYNVRTNGFNSTKSIILGPFFFIVFDFVLTCTSMPILVCNYFSYMPSHTSSISQLQAIIPFQMIYFDSGLCEPSITWFPTEAKGVICNGTQTSFIKQSCDITQPHNDRWLSAVGPPRITSWWGVITVNQCLNFKLKPFPVAPSTNDERDGHESMSCLLPFFSSARRTVESIIYVVHI